MIVLSVCVGVILNWLLGRSLVACLFEGAYRQLESVSRWALVYLTGQLLGSMTYWIWLCFDIHMYASWMLPDLLLIGVLFYFAYRKRKLNQSIHVPSPSMKQNQIFIWLAFAGVTFLILTYLASIIAKAPYGGWDAAAMWNYKVSYLVEPAANWTNVFGVFSSHPDYPLMHSISLARLCALTGDWQPLVSAWFGPFEAVLTLIVLVGTVMHMIGLRVALLGGLLLCVTDIWWEYATWQYADVTLGCYMLSGVALWTQWWCRDYREDQRLLFWSLLFVGACAWIKNEGWPYVLGMSLLTVIHLYFKPCKHKTTVLILAGCALMSVLWMPLWVHMLAAQTNDLIRGTREINLIQQLMSPDRIGKVAGFYWLYLRLLYPWGVAILFFGTCLTIGLMRPRPRSRLAIVVYLIFLGQWGVYLMVYMTTTHPLHWLLHTSGDRMFNQIWPIWILATCFLADCQKLMSKPG